MRLFAVWLLLSLAVGSGAASAQDQPASAEPEQQSLDAGQLDQLVAPIALYPDPLLAQVLMASTYPLEVVQADVERNLLLVKGAIPGGNNGFVLIRPTNKKRKAVVAKKK